MEESYNDEDSMTVIRLVICAGLHFDIAPPHTNFPKVVSHVISSSQSVNNAAFDNHEANIPLRRLRIFLLVRLVDAGDY